MKKKVLFLINSLKQGGAEKSVSLLAKKLNIKIILLEKDNFFKNENVYILNKKPLMKGLDLFISAYNLKKYVEKHNINIVQSHLLRANYVNILAKLMGSKHKVQIVNHSLLDRFEKSLIGKVHILLMKKLYRYADSSIFVSKILNYQFLSHNIILPSKGYIIYNPIEYSVIKKLMKEPIYDFQFNRNNTYLIMVGRINKIKRIDLIIKALNKIKNNNINLILIGKEEDIKIKDLLKLSNNPKRIHYLGPKTNPYKYIHKSDLLILSSESESFGNVIIESMACETPVISSDCGGPREILSPNILNKRLNQREGFEIGKYGILFPVNDEKSLKYSIEYLLQNKILYSSYKELGKKRAKMFDIENIAKKYKKVLLDEKDSD